MRHDGTHPAQRVVTARWTFTNADHDRADHFNPGNWHPDTCPTCRYIETQNVAARDQALAAKRDDDKAGARAVGTTLLILTAFATGIPGALNAWSWFTNLGEVRAWHLAWAPLFVITFLAVYGLTRIGKP